MTEDETGRKLTGDIEAHKATIKDRAERLDELMNEVELCVAIIKREARDARGKLKHLRENSPHWAAGVDVEFFLGETAGALVTKGAREILIPAVHPGNTP